MLISSSNLFLFKYPDHSAVIWWSLFKKIEVGKTLTDNLLSISPFSSKIFTYVASKLFNNALAVSFESKGELWSTPMTLILFGYLLIDLTRLGISFTQGGQEGYQKLIEALN